MDEREKGVRPTRRHMLAGIGLGMIGAMASGASGAQAATGPARRPSQPLADADLARADSETWAQYVGQDFAIPAVGGAVLRLVAVEEAPSGGPRPRRMRGQFHAIFESVGRTVPEGDATYVMAPRSASPLPLFLAGRASGGRRERLVATFG